MLSSAKPGGTAADKHNEGFAFISTIYTYILPNLWKINHQSVNSNVFLFVFERERLLNLYPGYLRRTRSNKTPWVQPIKSYLLLLSPLYGRVLLAFTYQEELSSPTWLPCQRESVSLRQVVLAGSTFESKKWGCLEKQSCQPHFSQTAVTQAVTSQGCVFTHSGGGRNRWASSLLSFRDCGLQNNEHIVHGSRSETQLQGEEEEAIKCKTFFTLRNTS